jgi:hypothetical protein
MCIYLCKNIPVHVHIHIHRCKMTQLILLDNLLLVTVAILIFTYSIEASFIITHNHCITNSWVPCVMSPGITVIIINPNYTSQEN